MVNTVMLCQYRGTHKDKCRTIDLIAESRDQAIISVGTNCYALSIRLAGGTYLLRRRDRVTTVTELNAIARPASSGLKVIPKKGYSAPAAKGTRTVL